MWCFTDLFVVLTNEECFKMLPSDPWQTLWAVNFFIFCVYLFFVFFILFVSLQMPPQWAQQIIFFDSIALKWYNSNFLHLSYCHYNSKIYILRWFVNQSIQMSNHWIKSNLTECWIDAFKQCKTNTRETHLATCCIIIIFYLLVDWAMTIPNFSPIVKSKELFFGYWLNVYLSN